MLVQIRSPFGLIDLRSTAPGAGSTAAGSVMTPALVVGTLISGRRGPVAGAAAARVVPAPAAPAAARPPVPSEKVTGPEIGKGPSAGASAGLSDAKALPRALATDVIACALPGAPALDPPPSAPRAASVRSAAADPGGGRGLAASSSKAVGAVAGGSEVGRAGKMDLGLGSWSLGRLMTFAASTLLEAAASVLTFAAARGGGEGAATGAVAAAAGAVSPFVAAVVAAATGAAGEATAAATGAATAEEGCVWAPMLDAAEAPAAAGGGAGAETTPAKLLLLLLFFLPKLAVVSVSSLLTVAGLAPASTSSFSNPAAALAAAGAKIAVDAGAAGGGGGEGKTFSTNRVAASRLGCTAATSCESVAAAPFGKGAVPALKEMEAAGGPDLELSGRGGRGLEDSRLGNSRRGSSGGGGRRQRARSRSRRLLRRRGQRRQERFHSVGCLQRLRQRPHVVRAQPQRRLVEPGLPRQGDRVELFFEFRVGVDVVFDFRNGGADGGGGRVGGALEGVVGCLGVDQRRALRGSGEVLLLLLEQELLGRRESRGALERRDGP